MDAFEISPLLRDWKLDVKFDKHQNRYHQRNSGAECWKEEKSLGTGGYGSVWQETCLWGPSKNAVRAVKHIARHESMFSAMKRELGALVIFSDSNHPEYRDHFVQFLGWFEDSRQFYLAMELCKDGDLDRHLSNRGTFPETEAALIAAQVAQALKYMHDQKIVHRDIKPLNILVACPGPRWHVKLADFGISKNTDGTALETGIGSKLYMAPEMWSSKPYTSAVDIWSLGAVVYCMRTGSPPFTSVEHLFNYRDHKERFPIRQLGHSGGFCVDFVTQAMFDVPERRLTIEQALEHEWLQSDFIHRSVSQRGKSDTNPTSDQTALNTWRTFSNTIDDTQPRPPRTPIGDPGFPSRDEPGTNTKSDQTALNTWRTSSNTIDDSQPRPPSTPTGNSWIKRFLSRGKPDTNTKNDETVLIKAVPNVWKPTSSTTIDQLRPRPPSKILGRKPGGYQASDDLQLASCSDDKTIKIWNPATAECISTLTVKGDGAKVVCVAWSHDASRLASASMSGTIIIWDPVQAAGYLSEFSGHHDTIRSMAWSHNDDRLASASDDKTIKIWDTTTSQCIFTLTGHSSWVNSIAWSHNSTRSRLASGSSDGKVKIWNPATGKCISTLEGHEGRVVSVVWAHGNRFLVSAQDDTIRLWDTRAAQCVSTLSGHSRWVNSIDFSHDSGQLVSGSGDKTMKIWNPMTGECTSTLSGHSDRVWSVAWSHVNGQRQLASGSSDKTIKIWNPETGECIQTLKGHLGKVNSVAWSA